MLFDGVRYCSNMAAKPRLSKRKWPGQQTHGSAPRNPAAKPVLNLRRLHPLPPLPSPPGSFPAIYTTSTLAPEPPPPKKRRRRPLVTDCDLIPEGNGIFKAVPRLPKDKLTVTEAARFANYSRDTVYRLYRAGFVIGEKQTPRKILIHTVSLQAHLHAVRDPAFWTPSRRARYWGY